MKENLSAEEQNRSLPTQEMNEETIKANSSVAVTVYQATDQGDPHSFLWSALLSSLLYRWGNNEMEGLHSLPKTTGLLSREQDLKMRKFHNTCYLYFDE